IGRTDLLEPVAYSVPGREGRLDVSPLLVKSEPPPARSGDLPPAEAATRTGSAGDELRVGSGLVTGLPPGSHLRRPLDHLSLSMCQDIKARLKEGALLVREYFIRHVYRTIGGMRFGELLRLVMYNGIAVGACE